MDGPPLTFTPVVITKDQQLQWLRAEITYLEDILSRHGNRQVRDLSSFIPLPPPPPPPPHMIKYLILIFCSQSCCLLSLYNLITEARSLLFGNFYIFLVFFLGRCNNDSAKIRKELKSVRKWYLYNRFSSTKNCQMRASWHTAQTILRIF